ncbi:MAG TPA: hypothetical protein VIM11_11375 [Tepidisphaeraceae bacterium]|jgi:hypothetical protein
MRLVLHPAGLIRFLKNQTEKRPAPAPKDVDRPDTEAAKDYEVTPYGRRPRRNFAARHKLTFTAVAVSAAAAAIWLLV